MDKIDIKRCAEFFTKHYLEIFYIITTYNGNSFILVGEKANFPHLMGIEKNKYKSNGYSKPAKLYSDILNGQAISRAIIPNNIATNSKMYKKVLNFCKSTDIIWHNEGPLAINYNEAVSKTNLSSVSILLVDLNSGYMMGWIDNKDVIISQEIKLKKYCIASWIDESTGNQAQKEKYMPSQDIDLIKSVLAFDKNSELIKEKKYTYNRSQKINILKCIERNGSNLLVDTTNERHYKNIALSDKIHCKINGVQY